jgi:hypothetical protein
MPGVDAPLAYYLVLDSDDPDMIALVEQEAADSGVTLVRDSAT